MNKDYYPTPNHLIDRMLGKIDRSSRIESILDPSAGNGQLLDHIREWMLIRREKLYAIEIESDLQKVITGKGYQLIGSDFLDYNGGDKFDLIVANFPFSDGDSHLLRAIDMMYNGQVVCLLNAATIKNPYSNERKLLLRKLDELNADIEYIQDAFLSNDTERKTDVEVALIHIKIENSIEADFFHDMSDEANDADIQIDKDQDLVTSDAIAALVKTYERDRDSIIGFLLEYYKRFNILYDVLPLKIESYLDLSESLTAKMQQHVNFALKKLRNKYWKKVLNTDDIYKYLSSKAHDAIEHELNSRLDMDFTLSNVRQFAINIVSNFSQNIIDSIDASFGALTLRHTVSEYSKNVQFFNGWKHNKAYKVNKKVIMPWVTFNCDSCRIIYGQEHYARDLDKCLAYLNGNLDIDVSIETAVRDGLNESDFFFIKVYKKGTIHLTFKDHRLLARFNRVAAKKRGWLPSNYGSKPYAECTPETKALIESFDGKDNYEVGDFIKVNNLPQLGFLGERN